MAKEHLLPATRVTGTGLMSAARNNLGKTLCRQALFGALTLYCVSRSSCSSTEYPYGYRKVRAPFVRYSTAVRTIQLPINLRSVRYSMYRRVTM